PALWGTYFYADYCAGFVRSFRFVNNQVTNQADWPLLHRNGITSFGEDAQGEATVKIAYEGRRWNGRGISTDIIEAAIKAYIAAINAMEWELAAVANGNGTKREVSQGV
ncbi:MAG: alpha-isopropylmalate synthase regulatory domain-containing protein, partial [Breznakiellaceae bacterium]